MAETSASASTEKPGSLELCHPDARKYLLVSAILASSLGFIDGSMVAIALPGIRESLDGNLVQAQWISNAYMLTLSALILVGGAAGDRFGLARIFGSGIMLFVFASIACALAPTPDFLIIARAVQGLGAAFMVPGSLALISRVYPDEERGRAIGIWAAAAAVTSGLGPIIGGVALTYGGPETWRWIFGINLPLGGIALFLLLTKIEQDPAQPERGIDFPGAVLATLALGMFAWALTGAETGRSFDTTYGLIGVVAFVAFLVVEAKSPHPMMPLGLFQNFGFSSANVISFCVYFAFSAILFYLPMVTIGGWGVTEIETSAAYAPLSVFISLLSGKAGKLADRYGAAPLLMSGSLVLAVGYACLAVAIPTENFWGAVMPAMTLQGIGMGLVVAPLSTAVMSSVGPNATGTASGINNAVTRMAGLMAVAAMGSVVAIGYAQAGGPGSFGEFSDLPLHGYASDQAFINVAWSASALCLIAALTAFITGLWQKSALH